MVRRGFNGIDLPSIFSVNNPAGPPLLTRGDGFGGDCCCCRGGGCGGGEPSSNDDATSCLVGTSLEDLDDGEDVVADVVVAAAWAS